jgi:4-cresol dehydrogenase (hydroxylating)
MHIGNDYKVATATTRFPWDRYDENRPLDPAAMEGLRRELKIGRWNGSGALYGTPGQVRDAKAQLRKALRGKVDRLQFVDDRLIGIMRRFGGAFRLISGWDVRKILTLLEPVYNLLKGVPTDSTLASTYWRKRTEAPPNPDPDRDGCGLLWCSPVAPNTGRDAIAVTTLASDVLLRHGFEPQISVSLATERSLICITTISYDRGIPGADQRARDCYDDLIAQLLARGYPPYRLNIASMQYAAGSGAYAGVLHRLKSALDPNGVLAPGRYEPAAVHAGLAPETPLTPTR